MPVLSLIAEQFADYGALLNKFRAINRLQIDAKYCNSVMSALVGEVGRWLWDPATDT